MAPELVTGEEEVEFSLKVDTWGLGVVAYELMHCRTPFRQGTVENRCVTKSFSEESRNLASTLQRARKQPDVSITTLLLQSVSKCFYAR